MEFIHGDCGWKVIGNNKIEFKTIYKNLIQLVTEIMDILIRIDAICAQIDCDKLNNHLVILKIGQAIGDTVHFISNI